MDGRCQKVKLLFWSNESSQCVRELQNFIGTITQQTIAAGLGRRASTLKYGLYHCSAHVFLGTELDLQVLLCVRLCSRRGCSWPGWVCGPSEKREAKPGDADVDAAPPSCKIMWYFFPQFTADFYDPTCGRYQGGWGVSYTGGVIQNHCAPHINPIAFMEILPIILIGAPTSAWKMIFPQSSNLLESQQGINGSTILMRLRAQVFDVARFPRASQIPTRHSIGVTGQTSSTYMAALPGVLTPGSWGSSHWKTKQHQLKEILSPSV